MSEFVQSIATYPQAIVASALILGICYVLAPWFGGDSP